VEKSLRVTCRKCGAELPAREGAGRPPAYCSTGCRRAAEYELRRAQDAVAAVEKRVLAHREHIALELPFGMECCGRGEALQRHIDWFEGERVRLEWRMAVLLDDDDRRSGHEQR
jgi:hypothetical protein